MQNQTTSDAFSSPLIIESMSVINSLRLMLQMHVNEAKAEARSADAAADSAEQHADFTAIFQQQLDVVSRLHHALTLLHGELLGANASPSIGAMACAATALAMANAPAGEALPALAN